MKNSALIILFFYLAIMGQAQSPVKYDKVIRMAVTCNNSMGIDLPPNDPEFSIIDPEYVNGILKKFTYADDLYDSTFTKTLVIYQSDKADSVLKVENVHDRYMFKKMNGQWHIKNFSITSNNMTLNHVAVGLTSKQVFKLLNKKITKKAGNGQVWVSNQTDRIVFTFSHDKVVAMKL